MKAIVCAKYGPPDDLGPREIGELAVRCQEVLE